MPLSIRVSNQIAGLAASLQEADEQSAALYERVAALTTERDALLVLLPDDARREWEATHRATEQPGAAEDS